MVHGIVRWQLSFGIHYLGESRQYKYDGIQWIQMQQIEKVVTIWLIKTATTVSVHAATYL